MKKAIVSGANSFIGSALVKLLLERGVEVLALCRPGRQDKLLAHPNLQIVPFDMTKVNEFALPTDSYDVFYHLAWVGGTDVANRSNYSLQLQNAYWTVEILKKAKQIGCQTFVGTGSIMEEEALCVAKVNGKQASRNHIYGAGKLAAHLMCQSLAVSLGISFIWGEITNAYGPGEISTRLINTTLRKCIQGQSPKFTSGKQAYDFMYIDDVAKALYRLGEKGKANTSYIVGSGYPQILKKFLLMLQAAVAPQLPFDFGGLSQTGVMLPLEAFKTDRLQKDTGFKAKVPFEEGIKKTYQWIKDQS